VPWLGPRLPSRRIVALEIAARRRSGVICRLLSFIVRRFGHISVDVLKDDSYTGRGTVAA